MRAGALPISELASRVADALARGDEDEAWRWLLQFVDDYRGSSGAAKALLTAERPPLTGDRRYDAAIAGLVEHLSAQSGNEVPDWTSEPARFAEPWWFVAGLPGYRASALRDSPISFKRHGVFLTDRALVRA